MKCVCVCEYAFVFMNKCEVRVSEHGCAFVYLKERECECASVANLDNIFAKGDHSCLTLSLASVELMPKISLSHSFRVFLTQIKISCFLLLEAFILKKLKKAFLRH